MTFNILQFIYSVHIYCLKKQFLEVLVNGDESNVPFLKDLKELYMSMIIGEVVNKCGKYLQIM